MTQRDRIAEIPIGRINWGDLRNQNPVSDKWGFDRGKPIDRYYIEHFLHKFESDVHGICIEVMDNSYTRQFGRSRVTDSDIVDINPNNPKATIIGDLTDADTLEPCKYDCFILTQTLPVIYDTHRVIKNCYAALKPGGSLLITVPALCRYSPHPEDHWRFTSTSLRRILQECTNAQSIHVEQFGNLVSSIAFLIGAASEELNESEITYNDPRFPILIAGRAIRTDQESNANV